MIVLAYDHRAYKMMQKIKRYFDDNNIEYKEFASKEYDKLDSYATFSLKANEYILAHKQSIGIYSCRSGVGVSIMANRCKSIRAGVCYNEKITFLAKNDDNINVCVLPCETVKYSKAIKIINVFLNTKFEGGRHLERVKMMDL